jgi:hypothetical protein
MGGNTYFHGIVSSYVKIFINIIRLLYASEQETNFKTD